MTASRQQCAQANVFLTLLKQAVDTLKQSAANNVDWKHYFVFRDKFITYREKMPAQKLKQLIISPNLEIKLSSIDSQTLKNIQYMRFNYYTFLKFLPEYQTFQGGPKELIAILKKGNSSLRSQIEKAKTSQKNL